MSCPCGKCHCYICGNPMTKVEPDPRDELIRLYESVLHAIGDGEVAGFDIYWAAEQAGEALAQGAEIKKRMEG